MAARTANRPRPARPDPGKRQRRRPGSTRSASPRRLVVIAVAVVTALLGGGVALFLLPAATAPGDVVATVDGQPVTRQELLFHMQRVQPAVADEIRRASGQTVSDWDRPEDGGAPVERLRTAAMAEIAQDHVVLDLGRQQGLVGFTTFEDFLATVSATNADRAAAVQRGDTVYGLTTFTADQLWTKTVTDTRTGLIDRLSQGADPVLSVSDADVSAYLQTHRDEWSAQAATFGTTRLTVPAAAAADLTATDVAAAVAESGDLPAAAARFPGATVDQVSVTSDTASSAAGMSPATLDQLQSGEVGTVTEPQTLRGSYVLFRLDSVTADPGRIQQVYGQRVASVLLQQRFDALIAQRVADTTTLPSHPAWESVTQEDLGR